MKFTKESTIVREEGLSANRGGAPGLMIALFDGFVEESVCCSPALCSTAVWYVERKKDNDVS